MFCPNCGRETTGKFCPFCGAKLTEPPAEPRPPASAGTPEPGGAAANTANQPPVFNGYSQPGSEAAYTQQPIPNAGSMPVQSPMPPMNPNQGRVFAGQPVPDGALGQSPAAQALRGLLKSPLFLLAALLFTLGAAAATWFNVEGLRYYADSLDAARDGSPEKIWLIAYLALYGLSIVADLLIAAGLWAVFASAASKRRTQMGTGGLSLLRLVTVVALTLAALIASFVAALLVWNNSTDSYSDFYRDAVRWLDRLLAKNGVLRPALDLSPLAYRNVFLGAILAASVLVVLYYSGLVKSVGTARRVVKTGGADHRFSVLAALLLVLLAGFAGYRAVWFFKEYSGTLNIVLGCSLILDALSGLLFAALLLRARHGQLRVEN